MKKEKMYPIVEQWLACKGEVDKVDFCKENRVSYHSLGYWQTKYHKEHSEISNPQSPSDFLPVKISKESSPNPSVSSPKAEIEFPSGLKLKIY